MVLTGLYPLAQNQEAEADFEGFSYEDPIFSESIVVQGNSLLSFSSLLLSEEKLKTVKKIKVVVTGYSSTSWQTDDTPFLTAAGTRVRDGVVAINILPFDTKIKLPSLYGDKIFVVEDRMSPGKQYHVDIWFSSYQEAVDFGAKTAEMEIVEPRMEIARK